MGVKGLQTFLKNNSDTLSIKVDISNTSLVIDANNLLCQTFAVLALDKESMNFRNDIYGGDFIAYGDLIRLFFENLDKCNITPILVYDGSVIGKQSTRNQVALKENETYRRGLEKFNFVKHAAEDSLFNDTNNVFLPKILNRVFKSIAIDLGIQSIQCPYEADSHIARIANDLNCPALTNDSDFFIYALKQGFLLLDYFCYTQVFKKKESKWPTIQCRLFRQNLINKVLPGFRLENMPLLSILLGNDYIEPGTFDRILHPILDRFYDGALKADTNNHRKIASLLFWLNNKSYDEAINFILNQVHPSNRHKLSSTFEVLNRNYMIEATDNFERELEEIYPSNLDSRNNVLPEHEPKVYYKRLFESLTLSTNLLDIIFHNTNFNYPTIDDFELVSSSFVKYRPFSVAVTLLRPASYTNLTTYRKKIQAEQDALIMYDRIDGDYNEVKIRPIETLDGYGSLEHMNAYSTITLLPSLKKKILPATFRFNLEEESLLSKTLSHVFSEKFTKEATTCFLLVKYIGIECKSNPKQEFVDALLMTIFYYAAIQQQISNIFGDTQYGSFLSRLRPHSYTNNKIQYKHSDRLFRRISHFISQLQNAYSAYNMLNGLLDFIHHKPKLELFFNGVLIFRLTKLLKLTELETKSLCGEMKKLFDVCEIVRTMTHSKA